MIQVDARFVDGQWLAVHELDCAFFHGVPTAWLGDEWDATVAITSSRRRGLAAIHALARHDLGGPAHLDGVVETAWVRFRWHSRYFTWELVPTTADDPDAVLVVIAHGVDLMEVAA